MAKINFRDIQITWTETYAESLSDYINRNRAFMEKWLRYHDAKRVYRLLPMSPSVKPLHIQGAGKGFNATLLR